jgi:putative ABC transport system substrate-binding protein
MQIDHLKRREFILLLSSAAASWPLAARAQQTERMRRVAILMNRGKDDAEGLARVGTFKEAMEQLG